MSTGWKRRSPPGKTGSGSSSVSHQPRRKRLSGVPERADTGKRPGDGQERLAAIPDVETLKAEMADFILRHKEFPQALQEQIAERLYLEDIGKDAVFAPFILPETIRVSVNPKNGRPLLRGALGCVRRQPDLPMVYMVTIEDSSEPIENAGDQGWQAQSGSTFHLPVGGLLNPEFARAFDAFAERNGAYSLSPVTIAQNLDADFEHLHPKQLRRFVLGPFYSAGVTDNSDRRISTILSKVARTKMPGF
jgi:hypothetical protein